MRNHSYEVQKGTEVKAAHVGKTVTWQKAQTIGEALGLAQDVGVQITRLIADATKVGTAHFENEAALVAAGEQQRDIAVREDIRTILGKDDGTLDVAAKAANELTIGAPRSSDGRVSKAVKPATKAKNASASAGNKMFEKALVDEKFRNQMLRLGMIEEAEFQTWVSAREAIAAEKPAAATPQPQA